MLHLPQSWDAMGERLMIHAAQTNAGDVTRGLSLHVNGADQTGPITIRFWGFVKDCAMVATGNWDGSAH